MNSTKDEHLPRLIPPSTLRRSTIFSTKENKLKSTQVTRRVTQLPAINNTLKRPMSATAIKTPSIRASATANKPPERLGTRTRDASSNAKNKLSLVKPVTQSSLNVPKNKIFQSSQGNKNLSLARNNIWSKPAGSEIKTTNNSRGNKSNGPIRLFSNLQKSDASTSTKPLTRLTRVNPNMNRPLRPMVTPAQKTQKPVVSGTSKNSTISSTRRRQTVSLKDIQTQFKPNPVSLQEILSSKTSRDVVKKRETLTGSKLGSKPSTNPRKSSISSSRSRMTYSYRVEKPRESRATIFSGALRIPRNNVKQNSRNTLIGKTPSRTLSTIRESSVRPSQEKSVSKKPTNQSLAARGAPRFTLTPAQRLSTSAFRRMTTSVISEKQTNVTGINTQHIQNSTTIQEVSSTRQIANVQQTANTQKNSVRTVESLVDPLRKMSIRRFSRKSFLMNDMSPQPMSMQASQRRVSYAFANNTSPNVVNADAERSNTMENDSQQQNTKVSIKKDRRFSNRDQTSLTSALEIHKEVESPKNDNLLTLAASIPLPPSPVDDNVKEQKGDITKESSNSNNNFSSDIEKARLYEELEELEKQLEQEISEDMSEII